MDKQETKLKVMEALQEEAYKGVVRIDSQTMRDIGVRPGDILEIEGARKTVGIVDRAYPTDVGQAVIRMDGILRRNAKTSLGEFVKIRRAEVKEARSITIAPSQKGVTIQADSIIFKRGLLGRALMKGDQVALGGTRRRRRAMEGGPFEDIFDIFEPDMGIFGFSGLKFIVLSADPKQAVVVTENTEVILNPKAVEILEEKVVDVTYEDIGGLQDEVKKIREMVELPLKHPELFQKLGIDPPKGVLLHGPPGTGKTLLARAVANETNAHFIHLDGPACMSKYVGEAEKRIRDIFEEAEKNAPSIIFIDEIDAIASKREESYGEVERRVVAQLLATMDGLKDRGKVVVIAATNRPNSIDPALRRPGRFDREVEIGVPKQESRLQILKIHTRNMPLNEDVKLEEVSRITHGFVGADMEVLCKEAAMVVLRRLLPEMKYKKDEPIPAEFLEKLEIKMADFMEALKYIRPTALREVFIERPNTTWEDIGGLAETKQELKEVVEWPLKNPDVFKNLGVKAPKGVLLYGPPGTGKTLLARAVANESEANFILVNGPELLNKFVGESLPYDEELIVRENSIVKRIKIGEIVEKKLDVDVLAFDKDKKVVFTKISDFIKHPLTGKLFEITTRTGRKIKVTDHHSLFSFINGKFGDIPTSHLISGESYIAVPKNLNLPRESLKEFNLYSYFKNDGNIFVANVSDYVFRARMILGLDKTANILGITKKVLSDAIGKNLPISIIKFNNLINEAKLALDYNEIKIKLKNSIHSYDCIFKIDSDLWNLIGVWVAEGDFNGYTIRIHNQNKEIRNKMHKICNKYGFTYSKMKNCMTINSLFLQKVFTNILSLSEGAENKSIPTILFTLDKESKAKFLQGYFSGDGSGCIKKNGCLAIEAGTISEKLANDLLYLLLDFGIVATCYKRLEKTGSITNRIGIFSIKNFERFKEIGFIDRLRNDRISYILSNQKWHVDEVIPLSGELYNMVIKDLPKNNHSMVRKNKLKEILLYVDKDQLDYKEYWDLVQGDIFFDMVKEIKELPSQDYVYDVSVPDGQNFIGGFGGIFAHNSEKGIRKVFEKARQASPCIIFFDEIDAIAPRRGRSSSDSGVTERMVNQLLTEIDGLQELNGVIIVGATNRPDIIDPALLRPGRFDRVMLIPVPDDKARLQILKIHTKNIPLTKDVDLGVLAEKTPNFVGSDVESLCREAAILALRKDINTKQVTMKDFNEALKKVKSSINSEDIKRYEEIEDEYLRTARGAAIREKDHLTYMG